MKLSAYLKLCLLTFIFLFTLAHWLILYLHLPVFTGLMGWFWRLSPEQNIPLHRLLLPFTFGVSAFFVAHFCKKFHFSKILLFIFIGAGLQFSFAFLEGRGTDAIKDRIIKTGHAEFAKVAVEQKSAWNFLSHYEPLLESQKLGYYPKSKPPGTLLFYYLTKKIAQMSMSVEESLNDSRVLENLQKTATYLWPFISYFVLIPLYYLTRIIAGASAAPIACLLYLMVPSVNLITLHTDQVIYPLLFMTPLFLMALATQKNNRLIAVIAGITFYLVVWTTFALVFLLPFALATTYFLSSDQRPRFKTTFILSTVMLMTTLLTGILFKLIFHYDVFERYQNAMAFHASWKAWTPGFKETFYYGFLNLLEYSVWVGVPLMSLWGAGLLLSGYDLFRNKKFSLESFLAPLFLTVIFVITFTGKTKGEVARLWMFLTPLLCLIAAQTLQRLFKNSSSRTMLLVTATLTFLQWVTVYFTKVNQDFW